MCAGVCCEVTGGVLVDKTGKDEVGKERVEDINAGEDDGMHAPAAGPPPSLRNLTSPI